MVVVRAIFFSTQFCKHQNFAFAFSKSFGILSSLLFPYSPWQTSRLALSFHRLNIFHICDSFFTSRLDSQHLIFALSTTDYFFRFLPSQEAITPASADVKRGGFFASAKKVTLFTVSCMHWLYFSFNFNGLKKLAFTYGWYILLGILHKIGARLWKPK